MYENVLMFGDFLLRMPELTKKVPHLNEILHIPCLCRCVQLLWALFKLYTCLSTLDTHIHTLHTAVIRFGRGPTCSGEA